MTGASNPNKLFNTLQARAALKEIALHALEADNGRTVYIATRWALTKQLDSLEEVEAWLDRVTGPLQVV